MIGKLLRALVLVCGLFLAPLIAITYAGPLLFERPIDASPRDAQFTLERMLPDVVANGLAFADIDHDGDDDLFVSSYPETGSAPSVLMENRGGTLVEATERFALPPLWGSSAFFADADTDGFPDLFFVEVAWRGEPATAMTRVRQFKNVNGGSFIEVKNDALNESVASSEGTLSFSDYDGDGDLDFAASFLGEGRKYAITPESRVFRRGTFLLGSSWVTTLCGGPMESALERESMLEELVAADFGSIEAFSARHGCLYQLRDYAPGILHLPFGPREDTAVFAMTPGEIRLFMNEGGLFRKAPVPVLQPLDMRSMRLRGVSGEMDWDISSGRFFQALSADINRDNRQDILVATDFGRNAFLVNKGDWRFVDAAGETELAIFGTGMGIAPGDPYRRGVIDYFFTNFGQTFRFVEKNGALRLDDTLSLSHLGFGWGIAFTDIDNDGWDDLYIGNGTRAFSQEDGSGYLETLAQGSFRDTGKGSYAGVFARNRLYANDSGRFHDVSGEAIPDLISSNRPVALSDIDGDGFEEIVVGGSGRPKGTGVYVFKNTGGTNRYAGILLKGTVSNAEGIGAVVTAIEGNEAGHAKLIAVGESFSSQHSLRKIFGLGDYRYSTVTIEVKWPSGVLQRSEVAIGTTTVLIEPR